ncbi:MAG TPA: hypothetical protein VGE18_00570 [Candidatus Paceibacterota bacterium]
MEKNHDINKSLEHTAPEVVPVVEGETVDVEHELVEAPQEQEQEPQTTEQESEQVQPEQAAEPVPESAVKETKSPEELQKEFEAQIKQIAFVNVAQLAENEARDVAEERLTEEREKSTGVKNFFKRVWKHNIAREYYRQREIADVKDAIYSQQNIFAGEALEKKSHQSAMDAVTERFLSEYDGVIREDAGEKKALLEEENPEVKTLKGEITEMIKGYANGSIDDATFDVERDRILESVGAVGKETVGEGRLYADNLKRVAEQLKHALNHGVSLENLDMKFDLKVGRAVSGVKTEANTNKVDRAIEWINKKTKGGSSILINETTVAAGVSIATAFGAAALKGAARTTAQVGGFMGGAALAGTMSAFKENSRLKNERAQHARDRAKGRVIDEDSPRREKMEAFQYKTKTAQELRSGLLSTLYTDNDPSKGISEEMKSPEKFKAALAALAEVEGRISVSNKARIDLISFSDAKAVEVERTALEIEHARAKTLLRNYYDSTPAINESIREKFDSLLAKDAGAYEKSLFDGDLSEKDKAFRAMKQKAVGRALVKGALSSVVVGGVVQEGMAFAQSNTEGFVEGLTVGNPTAEHATPLESLRVWISGKFGEKAADAVEVSNLHLKEVQWSNLREHLRFPEGTELTENGDGSVTITQGGTVLADHIPFEFGADHIPTAETLASLSAHKIIPGDVTVDSITEMIEGAPLSPKEYVDQNLEDTQAIKRDLWYDNNTTAPVFEKNELQADWGGENATGIDEKGNYVFSTAEMSKDGSTQGAFSADAKALAEKGELKMLLSLSKDTQNQVFEVPIDANGNAVIDPNSEVGKLFFTTVDGKAVFNGKYAEVAQIMKGAEGEAEHVRVLSTVVGKGIDTLPGMKESVVEEATHDFTFDTAPADLPRDTDLPPTIPLVGRIPLEPMKGPAEEKKEEKPLVDIPSMIPTAEQPPIAPPAVTVMDVAPDGTLMKENVQTGESEPVVAKNGQWNGEVEVDTPEQKKTEAISQADYDALRKDLDLINAKIQGHDGIITVNENDFASTLGRRRYLDLNRVPDGKPVSFNKEELRAIGDSLEKTLSESHIDSTLKPGEKERMLREGIALAEYNMLRADMEKINKEYAQGRNILSMNPDEFQSAYAKLRLFELKQEERARPALYRGELRTIGDEVEDLLVRGTIKN